MRKVKIPLMPKMKWLFRDNVDKKYEIRKIITLNALVVCLNIIYRLWVDILERNTHILSITFFYNRFQIYEVSWLYLCTMSEWIIMFLMNFFFAKCTKQHQQRLNKLQVSLEKPVKFQRRYYSILRYLKTWIGVHIFGWKKPISMKGESIMRICSSSNFDEIIIIYGVFG